MSTKDVMTFKEVCSESGLSMAFVRKQAAEGKLAYSQTKVEGTDIPLNVVARKDYESWAKGRKTRAHRSDGRVKMITYVLPSAIPQLAAQVGAEFISKPKSNYHKGDYRRRKAAKLAKK